MGGTYTEQTSTHTGAVQECSGCALDGASLTIGHSNFLLSEIRKLRSAARARAIRTGIPNFQMGGGSAGANKTSSRAESDATDGARGTLKDDMRNASQQETICREAIQAQYSSRGKHYSLLNERVKQVTLVEKLLFMTILCHFGHVIPNIRIYWDASFQTFISH